MGLITRVWKAVSAPWRLEQQLTGYVSAQQELLGEMLAITRLHAETTLQMQRFVTDLHSVMIVEGLPEGRPGLSDEEEAIEAFKRYDHEGLSKKWSDS